MKKILISLVVISLLAIGGNALAKGTTNIAAGGNATLALDADANKNVEVQMSPQVVGQYNPNESDAAGSVQWYSIATYHTGGTKTYGTASNVTSIYYTEDQLGFSGIPTTKASASVWSSDLGWSR